jgi:hypothetical protein
MQFIVNQYILFKKPKSYSFRFEILMSLCPENHAKFIILPETNGVDFIEGDIMKKTRHYLLVKTFVSEITFFIIIILH